MPRKPIIRTSQFAYHVVARCNNKEPYPLDLPVVMGIYKKQIAECEKQYGFVTHVFVLMNNHFHWIVSTPNCNLDDGMKPFMTKTSKRISFYCEKQNHLYGGRYKWTLLNSHRYFHNAFRYVLQNPLRAGVCNDVRNYPYTSLTDKELPFNCPEAYSDVIPQTYPELVKWLNIRQGTEWEKMVKTALKHTVFKVRLKDTNSVRLAKKFDLI